MVSGGEAGAGGSRFRGSGARGAIFQQFWPERNGINFLSCFSDIFRTESDLNTNFLKFCVKLDVSYFCLQKFPFISIHS